jgi:hypothetical protein
VRFPPILFVAITPLWLMMEAVVKIPSPPAATMVMGKDSSRSNYRALRLHRHLLRKGFLSAIRIVDLLWEIHRCHHDPHNGRAARMLVAYYLVGGHSRTLSGQSFLVAGGRNFAGLIGLDQYSAEAAEQDQVPERNHHAQYGRG